MGLATFDVARGWNELDTLFSGQWPNGMVPHILFQQTDPGYFPGPDCWGGTGPIASSGIRQPPISAIMAKLVFDRDPQLGAQCMAALFEPMLNCTAGSWTCGRIGGRSDSPTPERQAAKMHRAGTAPWRR
jgi:hypothetical protein